MRKVADMYEVFDPPNGWSADLLLVISPYFDIEFAQTILKRVKPRRVRFLIDDGACPEDVKKLADGCGGRNVKIALGKAAGLVHMKGFYLQYAKSDGARRKHRFIFGSANATDAAFGGGNAEFVGSVEFGSHKNKPLFSYLTDVLAAVENGDGVIDSLEYNKLICTPRLWLPAFKVAPTGPSPGFDAWLQRGMLASKYRDAQNFLMATVVLSNRLPQELVAQTFAARGLIEHGERSVVRFPYLESVAEDPNESATPQWKARYCIWTHLGDWLSDDCYQALGENMKSKIASERQGKINELLTNGRNETWKRERLDRFLSALDGVWQDLRAFNNQKVAPGSFLKGDRNGISRSHYSNVFDRKLASDLNMAADKHFHRRYVDGYDFPRVPKFRQDAIAWEEFVGSWCGSISIEAEKRASRSAITRAVKEATKHFGLNLFAMEPGAIQKWLRDTWHSALPLSEGEPTTVGDYVSVYFRDRRDG
ncbi:MAG TPA: hypothetical protein VEY95_09495 [Azospirillaceae bacterium]|nr:hypothetical protein [Azospirillaceae bacterium]